MIIPGQITIEVLLGPLNYIITTIVLSILLCMISAFYADKFADEAEKEKAKKENPSIDVSNIWVLEHGDSLSLAAGFLTAIVFVLPLINTIDAVGGFFGILSVAVLTGWGARKLLPAFADSMLNKRLKELEKQ